MTAFWTLVGLAAAAAVVDWVAVARDDTRLEYVAKPAVLALLTVAAAILPDAHTDLVDRRWWFVAALACCLIGDVLLMLPRDLFVPGLVAFLVGHVLFIVGLLQPPSPPGTPPFAFSTTGLLVAAVVALAVGAVPATLIFRSLVRDGAATLLVPVAVYLVAILTMAVLAANVGNPAAAVGAALFVVSDSVLALNRFVRPIPRGDVAVHVTYHLAQGLLVLSLVH
ncbi:MAG TPA: lysoplasmalogenase [Acidimicrobiales bacterium]